MSTAGRPTLRCLRDDLPNDWESAADAARVRQDRLDVPLTDLAHPIVRKAAEDFPLGGPVGRDQRQSISGLTDPVWWKVKIGSRWRGAVYEDLATGQAWLCAAGYRREGEQTDFYKSFMRAVSESGPGAFLPTVEDVGRLAQEDRVSRLRAWGAEIQEATRGGILPLLGVGGEVEFLVAHPRDSASVIATVSATLEVVADEDDFLLETTVSVSCEDWALLPLVQWVELVVLGAIDPREQHWSALPVGGVSTFSHLTSSKTELGLLREQLVAQREPGMVETGSNAHQVHRAGLTEATIEGEAVKALCGAWFVPRQDPLSVDPCPHCDAVIRALPA